MTTTVRRFCAAFAAFFAAGERGSWWFKPAFALYYRLVLRGRAAAQQRRRIVASAYEIAPLLRQAWAGFGRPQADIRALAAALDIPIWIAWAKQDRVIPLARCRAAIKTLRQATVTTFSGGHAAFLEQPARFVEGFDRFRQPRIILGEVRAPARRGRDGRPAGRRAARNTCGRPP